MACIDKLQVFWIFVNLYIHLGWEISLLFFFPYLEWDTPGVQGDITGNPNVTPCRTDDIHTDSCAPGWSPYNSFVLAFNAYGEHDKRYRVVRRGAWLPIECVHPDVFCAGGCPRFPP